MAYATAKKLDPDVISIIDITALRDGSNPKKVAKELHSASKGLGFIYIKGHGVPHSVINNARNVAHDFFSQTDDKKAEITVSPEHRGWIGTGSAIMGDDLKPDLKESFLWGFEDEKGIAPEGHSLRGTNKWSSYLPELKSHAMNYFNHANSVAHHLMRGFALGLNLDENYFLQTSDKPLSRASFVYYPEQPESMGIEQFGVGPHTDFGVLTILSQDDVGGLQIEDVSGEWIEAPPIEGTLIVNVADLLARWTDGAYKSTPHRVVNSSGKKRLSLVLAYDPNPETMIDAKGIYGDDYVAKEDAISCGDYLEWRFNKAFAHRKGSNHDG